MFLILQTTEKTANKNQANGYPSLNASSLVTQDPASKGNASGVAGLNASSQLTNALAAITQIPAGSNGQAIITRSGSSSWSAIAETDVTNLSSDLAATEKTANKNQASGYAGLNGSSQITASLAAATQIPAGSNGQALFTRTGSSAWSAIAESDVTNLQTDLAGTEKTANKNVANGYAGLNASSLITANLNAGVTLAGHLIETQNNKDVANGYAGLNASSAIISAQLGNAGQANIVIGGISDTLENFILEG